MNKHKAKWWHNNDDGRILCELCPRQCVIAEGECGFCSVRQNVDGALYALTYGYPVAVQVDPIEKKPLAEFMPGSTTFSIGTYGCNLDCIFCQNHHLSRGMYTDGKEYQYISPEEIVSLAKKHGCDSIAYTYNEPTIFGEYLVDIAKLAHEDGLANVLVSNGYISADAARDIYPLIDAANIDMKGFSQQFYADMTRSKLKPVLESIEYFYSLGHHLELTNLVIPGKNDSDEMISAYLEWVSDKLDKSVPLHFSAFHPDYQYHGSPRTSPGILYRARGLALEKGFSGVYLGNI